MNVCLLISLFILRFSTGCDLIQQLSQIVDVTGYLGESVVLPCSCTEPLAKPHQLQWKYGENHEEIYPSEHIERYKNRVTLLKQTTPGNLSLLLSSLTKEDDGYYLCSASPDQFTYIRLHVKERPHVHKTSTSQPSCSIQQEHTTTQPQEKQTHHTTLYVFCVKAGLSDISTLEMQRRKTKLTSDGPDLTREQENKDDHSRSRYSGVFDFNQYLHQQPFRIVR